MKKFLRACWLVLVFAAAAEAQDEPIKPSLLVDLVFTDVEMKPGDSKELFEQTKQLDIQWPTFNVHNHTSLINL